MRLKGLTAVGPPLLNSPLLDSLMFCSSAWEARKARASQNPGGSDSRGGGEERGEGCPQALVLLWSGRVGLTLLWPPDTCMATGAMAEPLTSPVLR